MLTQTSTKAIINTVVGVSGAVATNFLGGWDKWLSTLLLFMAIDLLMGCIVSLVFKSSTKTESGAYSSNSFVKGCFKKFAILVCIIIATKMDLLIGGNYVRNASCIAFICNEVLSINENLGLMGVNIPGVLMKSLDVLKGKEEK